LSISRTSVRIFGKECCEKGRIFDFVQYLPLIYLKTFYFTDNNSEQIKNTLNYFLRRAECN